MSNPSEKVRVQTWEDYKRIYGGYSVNDSSEIGAPSDGDPGLSRVMSPRDWLVWAVTWPGNKSIVRMYNRGQAKYYILVDIRNAGYRCSFTDMRARLATPGEIRVYPRSDTGL